jgi:hypothetical protein
MDRFTKMAENLLSNLETYRQGRRRRGSASTPSIDKNLDKLRGLSWRKDDDVNDDPSHELAHAMIAPPSRRKLKRFGLGPIGMGNGSKSCREEEEASILGILLQKEHGLDWRWTAVDHAWRFDVFSVKNAATCLKSLHKRRLIYMNGRPTFCRKAS